MVMLMVVVAIIMIIIGTISAGGKSKMMMISSKRRCTCRFLATCCKVIIFCLYRFHRRFKSVFPKFPGRAFGRSSVRLSTRPRRWHWIRRRRRRAVPFRPLPFLFLSSFMAYLRLPVSPVQSQYSLLLSSISLFSFSMISSVGNKHQPPPINI